MAIDTLRLKKGTVYRAVFCKNYKRFTRCFDRKWDAQKWLDQQEQLHFLGFNKKIIFSEATRIWLEHHSSTKKSPSGYAGDQRMLLNFDHFSTYELDQIVPEMIEQYIARRLKTGVKNATVNRDLECLRAIFNYFIKRRYLTVNPVSLVGLLPEDDAGYDYLSFDETDRLLSYANQRYAEQKRWVYRLYLLAINTGLRWGEIIALKWDKVDLHQKTIIVARSYCKVSEQIRETTKSRKVWYVGINSVLVPELKAQAEEVARLVNPLNLVFPHHQKIINPDNFKRDRFEKDLIASEIRLIRFHDLRHTFASHFMMKGGNLYDLQKLMGHSNIKTTERYAHLSPQSLVNRTELVAIEGGKKEVISIEKYRERTAGKNPLHKIYTQNKKALNSNELSA